MVKKDHLHRVRGEEMNFNEKDILVVRMRTSKRETENNYRKDYRDTNTLSKVKLEPTDDLLEQAYTGTDDRPLDGDNRALPAINIEKISLNPNIAISRAIPINPARTLLSPRARKVRKDARGQEAHDRRYEYWIRWYEKGNNKAKHNTAASKRSTEYYFSIRPEICQRTYKWINGSIKGQR